MSTLTFKPRPKKNTENLMNISVFQLFWEVLIFSARVRLAISPLLHLPWTTTRRTPKTGPGAKGELRKAWIKAERNKENMQTQSYFLDPQIFSMIPVFHKKQTYIAGLTFQKYVFYTSDFALHPDLEIFDFQTLTLLRLRSPPCHKWIVMATETTN